MILAVDGYEANVSKRVGSGRYAFEILSSLYALLAKRATQGDDTVQVKVYLPSFPLPDMPLETSWWHYRVAGPSRLWTFIGLPWALENDRPHADVVFSPTHYAPRFIKIPRVISVMDLSYLAYPELFLAKDLHQLTHWTKYSVSHAARIFTISNFSKNAIMDTYHIPGYRIVVTYPGFRMPQIPGGAEFSSISKKYHIGQHYILSVGTLQPRKNYVRLIEAFSIFLAQNKQKFRTVTLVIVGKRGWLYKEILEASRQYGVEDTVVFLDFVPDEDLPMLYTHALCFALPSLYEGFGLPVLEAMTYGCQVVVSNVSSLPEIAGKAGIYVDPHSAEDIARGLLTAVRQRNLIQGKNRIKEGYRQAKQFTWERAAETTLSVLEALGTGEKGS